MKQSQKYTRVNYSAEPRVYLGIPFTRVTVNLRLVNHFRPISAIHVTELLKAQISLPTSPTKET